MYFCIFPGLVSKNTLTHAKNLHFLSIAAEFLKKGRVAALQCQGGDVAAAQGDAGEGESCGFVNKMSRKVTARQLTATYFVRRD